MKYRVDWAELEIYGEEVTPEKLLLIYIIDRAILDYKKRKIYPRSKENLVTQEERTTARRFLFVDYHPSTPWSLYWICEFLHADPKWLVAKVRAHAKAVRLSDGRGIKRINACKGEPSRARNYIVGKKKMIGVIQ